MQKISIKIAHHRQANQPVLLRSDGSVSCGPYHYQGRYKKEFQQFYDEIVGLAHTKPIKGILDVSQYKCWDAISTHEEITVPNWQKTISAIKIRRLADETQIRMITAKIWPEIKRSAIAKWKNLFRKSRRDATSTLRHAWELFLP
jgi:hypothetical protein